MPETVENSAADGATPPPKRGELGRGELGRGELTRRELRRREREAEAAASDAPMATASTACRMPPLVTVTGAQAAPRPRHRGRRWLGRSAGVLAMGFVAAMAVATSVPAMALLSHDQIAAQVAAAAPAVSTSADGALRQSVRSSDSVIGQVLAHDDYTVKSFEQLVDLSHIRIAGTFTNDPNGTIQWPFPVGVPIADYYGPRIAPTEGASSFHEGVDFDPGYGVDIHSIADGTVREVQSYDDNALGVHVIIDHMIGGQLVSSVYGHMKPGSIKVHIGQHVKVADVIGQVGSTGVSTGAHLHFEIRLGGTQAVDPYAWLQQHAT